MHDHSEADAFDWNGAYQGDGSDTTPLDEQLLADVLHLPPGKALDLGCGAGGNAIGLTHRGWTVTGIDAAPKAIASARLSSQAAGVEIVFQVADITTWQPDQAYDLVISSYSLPPRGHLRDAAVATARSALAPGGTLVIGEWDRDDAQWASPDDFVTVEELVAALEGLDIERAESVPVAPHTHSEDAHDHPHPASERRAVIVVARSATAIA